MYITSGWGIDSEKVVDTNYMPKNGTADKRMELSSFIKCMFEQSLSCKKPFIHEEHEWKDNHEKLFTSSAFCIKSVQTMGLTDITNTIF